MIDVLQESPSSWLDTVLPHISEIIQLEDVPSIQMEVAVLVREFPDIRYRISVPANAVVNATANVNANINVHTTVNNKTNVIAKAIVMDTVNAIGNAYAIAYDSAKNTFNNAAGDIIDCSFFCSCTYDYKILMLMLLLLVIAIAMLVLLLCHGFCQFRYLLALFSASFLVAVCTSERGGGSYGSSLGQMVCFHMRTKISFKLATTIHAQ